jgi:hypothetical protein
MLAGVRLGEIIRGITQQKLIILVIFVLASSANAIASGKATAGPDTTIVHVSNPGARADSARYMATLALGVCPGILTNGTFGTHFVLDVSAGLVVKKELFTNSMRLVYEHRFGNSSKQYQISDNDSLKSVDNYNANFWGLEFRQRLLENPYYDLHAVIGAGYDWITVKRSSYILDARAIGGLALNIGLDYGLFIAKKYGPDIELAYHYANLANEKGTKLDPSSLLIMLTFSFGHAQK